MGDWYLNMNCNSRVTLHEFLAVAGFGLIWLRPPKHTL